MILFTGMVTTNMYWVRQLSAEHTHIQYFIEAQQERELFLNALTYSIHNVMKELHGQELQVPWEQVTTYETMTITYQSRTKNSVAIVIYHYKSNHSLHAEWYIEYLSNNKKRCTLHMVP
jgi:hypothetical protein